MLTHLIKRAVGTALPLGPPAAEDRWAVAQLLPAEAELWRRMKRCDRRHAVGVARRAESVLGAQATRPVLAAALLHDVGKVESGFGAYRRTMATLAGLAVRREPEVIRAWTRSRGVTRRVGLYLQHDRLGGDLLALAGSDSLTEAWARQHHRPEADWTVPLVVGRALKAADDD